MYPSIRGLPASTNESATSGTAIFSRNLIALSFTSFFSDISSEMVIAVVPLFLTGSLGFTILGFSLFESAYQGTNAIFRLWGGSIADRRQRHKSTAAHGYTISAATRIGLFASSLTFLPAVPFLLADRIGKGLRTAPRDALISLSTPRTHLGTAFGVHRAFDTAGALLGPLIAFLILWAAPGAFDAVFLMSAVAGIIGVLIIRRFAEEKPQPQAHPTVSHRVTQQWREVLRSAGVKRLVIAVTALSVATVGDAFLYLMIQRSTNMAPRLFPLLFVGTAVVYLVLAVPVGKAADRFGHRAIFLIGNAPLIAIYFVLASAFIDTRVVVACMVLLGAYYAATDGVVPAIVSRLVGPHVRASGIALVTVVIAVARMISAVAFGTLWQAYGQRVAILVFGIGMTVALAIAILCLGSDTQRQLLKGTIQ